jgi:hypothetical protein
MKPLNGAKTHPLSEHARQLLAEIANTPLAAHAVNPGVTNRLLRENAVELVSMASPFKSHKGGKCQFLCITDIGRRIVREEDVGIDKAIQARGDKR